MPKTTIISKKLSPTLKKELRRYFETHDCERLSRNLRRMLLDYLSHELRIGVPLYLEEFLWQLNDLFDLLDVAAKETKDWHPPPKKKKKK